MSQSLQSFSYHQPECELSLQAKVSPLSQWLERTILAELDFSLRVGNSRLKGDQQLLQELMIAVANYLESYLHWDRVGELANKHQISYGRWRKLELTTLELFDLHVVLEELSIQCQLLPKISISSRPAWWGMVAILIAVVGVGTWKMVNPEAMPQLPRGETPVAVHPEVQKPPIASKDSSDLVAPEIVPPQPLKPADPVPKGAKIPDSNYEGKQDEAISVPSVTAPASGEPTSRVNRSDAAMIPQESRPAPVPNQPQAKPPSVSNKIRIVSMRKLTAIAPSSGEPNYAKAIAQLNTQLGAKLDGQKVIMSEAIPRELVLILTAVKVENKQKLWLRAEANQANVVKQMVALLQEALNRDSKIELPAGEYELLLQIAEENTLGGTK